MRPVQIALKLIEVLGRKQPAGVSELGREMDLPKSTVQRSLKVLHQSGWIEPSSDDPGTWVLSLHALVSIGSADIAVRPLRMAAVPVMEELRRRTEESIYLAVVHNSRMVLMERLDGIKPVVHAWPLWRSGPLHTTSLGKAILANLSPQEQDAYLKGGLIQRTSRTATKPETLRKELAVTRERGFSLALQTNWPDENGVGSAIFGASGRPFAAISISAPVDRMPEKKCYQYGPLLLDAARRISMGIIPHGTTVSSVRSSYTGRAENIYRDVAEQKPRGAKFKRPRGTPR